MSVQSVVRMMLIMLASWGLSRLAGQYMGFSNVEMTLVAVLVGSRLVDFFQTRWLFSDEARARNLQEKNPMIRFPAMVLLGLLPTIALVYYFPGYRLFVLSTSAIVSILPVFWNIRIGVGWR